jgi:transcriptional regulator with XRE-family HTH domain
MRKSAKAPDARSLLAVNVQKIRIEMGLSQEKLAEKAGFHRTYVSQVERCVANTTTDNIQKLADVLAVPVARLFEPPKGELAELPTP